MDAVQSELPGFVLDGVAWLVTYALHSTALLLAALVAFAWIERAAKRSQRLADGAPAWRERVGRVALLGGIVTASVQTALGIEPFGLRPALLETVVIAADSDRAVATPSGSTTFPASPAPAATIADNVGVPQPTTSSHSNLLTVPIYLWPAVSVMQHVSGLVTPTVESPSSGIRAQPSAPAKANDSRSFWIAAFVASWALVASASFARRFLGWRELRSSLLGAEPVALPDVLATFDEVLTRAGLRRDGLFGVRLLVAQNLAAPMTRGVLRREVCVPPRALDDLCDDELAALFGHEVAHARRGDPAWLLVFRALEIVFCLQPLNRVVARRLEDDAELLCDDRAVVWTGGRLPLASCLTEVASWLVPSHGTLRLAASMASHGARLSRRVERLVDDSHALDSGRRRPLFTAGVVALAASAVAVVPGFAAQRGPKPLPLDLRLEMWLATDASERESDSMDSTSRSNADWVDAIESTREPSEDLGEPALAAVSERPLDHLKTTVDAPKSPALLQHGPMLGPLGGGDVATTWLPDSVARDLVSHSPMPEPASTALADVLVELEREVTDLRTALDERAGGTRLLPDVDALALRVEALRYRESALTALIDVSRNTLLSPATTGPTAEDR